MDMRQKITVITGTTASIPLIQWLNEKGKLAGVILSPNQQALLPTFQGFIANCPIRVAENGNRPDLPLETDLVVVMAYAFKVQLDTLTLNIHFGPLPENRGSDPLFWTLKQGKRLAYVTIHEATDELDAGDIWITKGYDIPPGENYGLLYGKLATQLPALFEILLEKPVKPVPQGSQGTTHATPSIHDQRIDWSVMNSSEIERLVNACNPNYGGALTTLLGNPLRILEVIPTEVNMSTNSPQPIPGSIVHSSPEHGLVISCINERYLKINILSTPEGVFSGQKLGAMGTPVGTVLG